MTAKRWTAFCDNRPSCLGYFVLWRWCPAPEAPPECPNCGNLGRLVVEKLPRLRANALQQKMMAAAGNNSLKLRLVGPNASDIGGAYVEPHGRSFSAVSVKSCIHKGFLRQACYPPTPNRSGTRISASLIGPHIDPRLLLTRKGWNALPERLQAGVPVPAMAPGETAEGDYF